jgi:hypothetical protein
MNGLGGVVHAVQYHSIDATTMTLWPSQDQANEEMWAEYKRRTSRPGLLEEEAAKERPPVAEPPAETTVRRGKLSENPQPEKDA